eukprot:CAMPEP_0184692228 /NCGR_PEP_ID=MMETSP0313-20130426/797_1 /TAXON_ID=2792 /ORGANISM="Porphyridium aerugineum, Strain SAG 1380-2" /LENGTH=189 /DNA_ID=CAMNT_0027150043 /DNA_START=191 /DNA_END=760 /DNA_ORIENTATION=-
MDGLHAITTEPANKPVIRKFVLFSISMLVFPLLFFFGFQQLIKISNTPDSNETVSAVAKWVLSKFKFLGIQDQNAGTVFSALAAVGVANLIMMVFVISAIKEDNKQYEKPATAPEPVRTTTQKSLSRGGSQIRRIGSTSILIPPEVAKSLNSPTNQSESSLISEAPVAKAEGSKKVYPGEESSESKKSQ